MMFSYELLHMDKLVLVNQQKHVHQLSADIECRLKNLPWVMVDRYPMLLACLDKEILKKLHW